MATKSQTQENTEQPSLLTKEQVAKRLQLSTRTVYRKWQEGVLPPPVKLGAVIRWRSDVLDRWIENDCQPLNS